MLNITKTIFENFFDLAYVKDTKLQHFSPKGDQHHISTMTRINV